MKTSSWETDVNFISGILGLCQCLLASCSTFLFIILFSKTWVNIIKLDCHKMLGNFTVSGEWSPCIQLINDKVRRRTCQSPVTSQYDKIVTSVWRYCLSQSVTGSFACCTSSRQPFPSRLDMYEWSTKTDLTSCSTTWPTTHSWSLLIVAECTELFNVASVVEDGYQLYHPFIVFNCWLLVIVLQQIRYSEKNEYYHEWWCEVYDAGLWSTCGRERQERHLSSVVRPMCLWSWTQKWRQYDVHGNFMILIFYNFVHTVHFYHMMVL